MGEPLVAIRTSEEARRNAWALSGNLQGIPDYFRVMIASIVLPLCVFIGPAAAATAQVDASRLEHADQDPANWLIYGRTYGEQRFSPLARITADNANRLGLAWYADFDINRGQEATPLIIDGVMYVSTAWSVVKAFDAKTGKPLWSYDAAVPRELGVKGCCDVVNPGVTAWKGKIYVATFDGRLVALDAGTGKPVWSVLTIDPGKPYTITQAPRVIKDRVVIGTSGSEYGVRGYISAYDAETGQLAWRFYTVPGDPSKPFENEAMAMAAKTWHGEWWKLGGGGTVWESISYDPELNLIYFGVSNGVEWNQAYRSAGQGDNLFLSSIVAVNADTGAYVWHYQATPGEEWDYDAVQQLILADLSIDGTQRQILMQANKNGFFYVLDRKTGQLISANAFTPVSWASGVDQKTGRPIENPEARYDKTGKQVQLLPGALGAHSWQAMAFNPKTGLVYIPAQEIGMAYAGAKDFKPAPIGWNTAVTTENTPGVKGYLVAWDPVKQKQIWRDNYLGPWNGGALTTAGNLVVQGNAAGDFSVYRADNGEKLWSTSAQTPVMAAPATYEVDGEQHIAVVAGWGGAYPFMEGRQAAKSGNTRNISRVLVFKLGGKASLPPVGPTLQTALPPPPDTAQPDTVAAGEGLFARFCSVCHGEAAVAGGVIPDLRTSPYLPVDAWYHIVLDGILKINGMAPFGAVLNRSDVTAIRAYLIRRANQDNAAVAEGHAREPDVSHGAVIAAQGTAAGAPGCARCHAFNGVSDGSGAFPRIAGQSAFYLAEQLRAFRSGVRLNAIMSPVARALSEDDISDVTAYYSGVNAPFLPLRTITDAGLLDEGKRLATNGSEEKGISGCENCHGADGAGESPTIPYLGGQYEHYIAFELQMWQRGFRKTGPDAMTLFAKKPDDRDIAAVSAYYQQLRAPTDRAAQQ
jgi:quinohemoprotein ethanol dehydrogenase